MSERDPAPDRMRIGHARIRFEGLRTSPERATEVSQRALREIARRWASVGRPSATHAQVPLIVRVPHGASDAAIAARIADAFGHRITGTGA